MLLKNKAGKSFTSISEINRLIAPNEVGTFSITGKVSEENAYHFIPKELDALCRKRGLQPTIALTAGPHLKEKIEVSMIPHINHWGETHFVFAGELILYFNMPPLFALRLEAGDWVFNEGSTEQWINFNDESFFTIASYHAAPLTPVDEFHKRREFTKTVPDYSIL